MDRPLENSYWVVPGSLLAGEHPSEGDDTETLARVQRLIDAGIDSFLDLTHSGERPEYLRLLPQRVRVQRSPIRDTTVPLNVAEMRAIQSYIADSLAGGRCLYVHCRAGIGRTGTVVGCYLAETGLDGPSALAELNRLWQQSGRAASWPEVPQTLEQADFIRHWPRFRRSQAESAALSSRRDMRERFVGCLLGLAIGDALSARSQHRSPGTFMAITEIAGGGVFELPVGHWSDDTALSLCVAEGLLNCQGWVAGDQAERFGRWQKEGHLTAGGYCTGLTPGTARWLHRQVPGAPRPALASTAINFEAAPLSRVAPLTMFHFAQGVQAVRAAAEAAAALDPAPAVIDASRGLAAMLHSALHGEPLARVLSPRPSLFGEQPLSQALETLLDRDPTRSPEPQAQPALTALSTARWVLATSGAFRSGALRIANMGGDSDVIGAVHGQLAGAFYGQASIPGGWLRTLARADRIEAFAVRLYDAGAPP
ncbi:MAG TPA: ADP-ribosylglycohydrolase family protein [Steroidobacteraceae bacterium]|jgi:ADP-ribosyl-[dinitrogen reductase] hydrolase|nr:ADP-ribosylglycohydrolase family protein [Steroidobacteraceae bacterium]